MCIVILVILRYRSSYNTMHSGDTLFGNYSQGNYTWTNFVLFCQICHFFVAFNTCLTKSSSRTHPNVTALCVKCTCFIAQNFSLLVGVVLHAFAALLGSSYCIIIINLMEKQNSTRI